MKSSVTIVVGLLSLCRFGHDDIRASPGDPGRLARHRGHRNWCELDPQQEPATRLVHLHQAALQHRDDRGTTPRKDLPTAQDPEKLTDAEKMARYEAWELLTANAGTYEIKGTTLTIHPMVAKNPSVMGQAQTREFKIDGKTLTLIQKSTTAPGTETRTVLTRVE
ncbi:hypothetical protein BH18ACI5_BH18ACI5_05850 [soil metagenome]